MELFLYIVTLDDCYTIPVKAKKASDAEKTAKEYVKTTFGYDADKATNIRMTDVNDIIICKY